MASDVEKLVAKWRAEAVQLREQASRAQKRGDGTDLELFQSAQDAEGYADELEAALRLTQPAASGEVVAWQRRIRTGDGKWHEWLDFTPMDENDRFPKHVGRWDAEYRPLYTTPQPDADTVRLDWLIEQHATLFTDGCGYWQVAYEYTSPTTYGPMADSPRAAIDSAIKGEK